MYCRTGSLTKTSFEQLLLIVITLWQLAFYGVYHTKLLRTAGHQLKFQKYLDSRPVSKIVFLKTHKTGSSTLQNIFYRRCEHEQLNILLPKNNHIFSFAKPFNTSQVFPYAPEKIDCILNHMRFDYDVVKQYISKDEGGFFVTILRNAADVFESRVNYYKLARRLHVEVTGNNSREEALQFIQNIERGRIHGGLATMVISNWFYAQLTPSAKLNQSLYYVDNEKIEDSIQFLEEVFDLVLISDLFDESIVVLQHYLKWPLEDFAYFSLNERQHGSRMNKSLLSSEDEKLYQSLVQKHINADHKMYQHFRQKLEKEIAKLGRSYVNQQVAKLTSIREQLHTDCEVQKSFDIENMHNLDELSHLSSNLANLTPSIAEKCEEFVRTDSQWVFLLRQKQEMENSQRKL